MAREKPYEKPDANLPEAFITIARKDDFTFELVEVRAGMHKVLLAEVFPIVMDRAHDWFIKECKL